MSILAPDTNHHEEWPGLSKGGIDEYVSGKCSFLTVIMPATLVNLDAAIVLDVLQQNWGKTPSLKPWIGKKQYRVQLKREPQIPGLSRRIW